jgi:SAM-dependent methyltransferase
MTGYDPNFFALLDAVEDRHFWFRARRRAVRTIASQAARGFAPPYRALELGCGNGSMLPVLQRACPRATVIGMDLFAQGLTHARRRVNCPLVQADLRRHPFSVPFQIIAMFDVLEHLQDDLQVLRQVRTMLAPDGVLLLTVPAHPFLWSYFDEASGHARRYTTGALRRVLEDAGFKIEYITQFMAAILPLLWLARRRPSPSAAAELRIRPGLNGILNAVLSPEVVMLRHRWRLPMGTSLLAAARVQPQNQ